MGASGPFIIDTGGKGRRGPMVAGGQLVTLHSALCTLHRMAGRPETHIRCQDGPSNLVECDAGDTCVIEKAGKAMECRPVEHMCKALT